MLMKFCKSTRQFQTNKLFDLQIGLAITEVLLSAACNPRLWSVAWIAVSAAAEIFIYLVLALATVFVAIIINIYEGSRRDVRFDGEGPPNSESLPKGMIFDSKNANFIWFCLTDDVVMPSLSSDIESKPLRVQKKD